MIELIKQRLKSKTYWAAIIGLAITWAESRSGLAAAYLAPEYREYLVFAWPILMLTLRELTTSALSDK